MEPERREPDSGQTTEAHLAQAQGEAEAGRRIRASAREDGPGRSRPADGRLRDPFARPGDGAGSLGQNSAMRDLAHGVIGALIAYAVYKLAGHAIWSLAALAAYLPIYLMVRDRLPLRRGRGRTSDRT